MKTSSKKLHEARLAAFHAGEYSFHVPPVCTQAWTPDDWILWVRFSNPELNRETENEEGEQ